MKQDKELKQASEYLSSLYKIEEYDTLDISAELNVEKLLKAKEYFIGKMQEYGYLLGQLETEVELAHTYYKVKYADACVRWESQKSEKTGKYYTTTAAEKKADIDTDYVAAKDNYAKLKGEYTYIKSTYYWIQERISACQQHISILRKEENFDQFVKKDSNE